MDSLGESARRPEYELRYDPFDPEGPCAMMFRDKFWAAVKANDIDRLADLGNAWYDSQVRADRDQPRPRDMAERTAEYALERLRTGRAGTRSPDA